MTAGPSRDPVGTMWAFEMRNAECGMRNADSSNDSAFRIPHSAFERASVAEAAELTEAMGLDGPAPVLERLARGSRCYVARVDGALASYGWVSFGEEWISELAMHIRLAPGDVYIWDCATLPAYRGQGLYPALLGHMVNELRAEGLHRAWIGADTGSVASQKGIVRAGFQPIADFYPAPATSADRFTITGRAGAPADLMRDIRQAFLA
jgi:ribosomal protein S18 acetylase RimI-like enzyme